MNGCVARLNNHSPTTPEWRKLTIWGPGAIPLGTDENATGVERKLHRAVIVTRSPRIGIEREVTRCGGCGGRKENRGGSESLAAQPILKAIGRGVGLGPGQEG
jgi:hypothetical protein